MSTSSSSSSSEDGGDGGNGNGNGGGAFAPVFDAPSPSRRRSNNEVWPEPFLEALALQVATEASRSSGRLAAAPALANVFQVCSTWRAVSLSDLLWRRLTRVIWGRTHLRHPTWRQDYMYRHRTALNFRAGRSLHLFLHFDPSDVDTPDGLICRSLVLSDLHLAAGFADGTVRLFDLVYRHHIRTYRPHHRDLLGRFSRAVSGIILSDSRLVFATMDGDIHVAAINGDVRTRRVHLGDLVNDGALVDFTGSGRWWVGLYAGVPGRAFHIWDGREEERLFVGGSFTDPEAVMGWHMLTELNEFVGRVRVTSQESAVACTSSRVIIFDLRNQGVIFHEEEHRRGVVVTSMDVSQDVYMVAESRGWAVVRRVETLEEVSRFPVRQRHVMGCMNLQCAMISGGGVVRVWEVAMGEGRYLYRLRERVGEVSAMVADDRHVAVAGDDTRIHLWDFGAAD